MKRSELQHPLDQALQHVRLMATLVLCAAALAGPAHARGSVVNTVLEMAQAVAQENPMPSAFDGLPCASCYLAPAPTVHGFIGEFEEPKQSAWQLLAKPSASAQKPLGRVSVHTACVVGQACRSLITNPAINVVTLL